MAYKMTGMTGSFTYMAPEVTRCEPYSEKVCLCHLCCRCHFCCLCHLCCLCRCEPYSEKVCLRRRCTGRQVAAVAPVTGSCTHMAHEVTCCEPYSEKVCRRLCHRCHLCRRWTVRQGAPVAKETEHSFSGTRRRVQVDIFSLGIIMFELFSMNLVAILACKSGESDELPSYAARVAAGHREKLRPTWPQPLQVCLCPRAVGLPSLALLFCLLLFCCAPVSGLQVA